MGITKEKFGVDKNGNSITKYTISNSNGMQASVIDFGAILTNLVVNGKDIVLGYDKLDDYFENGSFFGATVGPNANRTANASFEINGQKYNLDVNDGPNNLHSHMEKGYHKRFFNTVEGANGVTFSLEDEDGSMGFPGNKKVCVEYSLTDDNELKITYNVTSDKDTIINLTNHTYFNLNGHDAGKIEDHVLTLNASRYTPVVKGAIPTGELAPVAGTVFDFTKPRRVGESINDDVEQLKLVQGYDHNWVIDGADGTMRKIAEVTADKSDLKMEVYTDLPGVQFYAGNCIGETVGKGSVDYSPRCGLCLETQYYPNTANEPSFPSAVYGPNRDYNTTTIYKFI